jgi:hypothetical protein
MRPIGSIASIRASKLKPSERDCPQSQRPYRSRELASDLALAGELSQVLPLREPRSASGLDFGLSLARLVCYPNGCNE